MARTVHVRLDITLDLSTPDETPARAVDVQEAFVEEVEAIEAFVGDAGYRVVKVEAL